jgi:hypothetical protein
MRFDDSLPYQLFVRRPGTNKFLRASGRWTKKAEAAFRFPNPLNAINHCFASGLKEVELVFRYERAEQCLLLNCA